MVYPLDLGGISWDFGDLTCLTHETWGYRDIMGDMAKQDPNIGFTVPSANLSQFANIQITSVNWAFHPGKRP